MSRYREPTIPKYDRWVFVNLNADQRTAVEQLAEREQKSLSWWVRTLVQEAIDRSELSEELQPVGVRQD
jgi:hypothetical protein